MLLQCCWINSLNQIQFYLHRHTDNPILHFCIRLNQVDYFWYLWKVFRRSRKILKYLGLICELKTFPAGTMRQADSLHRPHWKWTTLWLQIAGRKKSVERQISYFPMPRTISFAGRVHCDSSYLSSPQVLAEPPFTTHWPFFFCYFHPHCEDVWKVTGFEGNVHLRARFTWVCFQYLAFDNMKL